MSTEDDVSEVIYVDADDTRTVQPSGRSRPLLTAVVAGPQGPAGVAGLPGDDGDDAYGIPGPVGIQGAIGNAGAQGPPGVPGWQGDDGEDGWPGPMGPAAATNPLANFSAILPTAYLTPAFAQLPFTAPVTNAGGYFSNTTSRWTPPPAPVVLTCSLVVSCFNLTAVLLLLGIFKDNVQVASGSCVVQGDGSLAAASVTAVDVASGSSVYDARAMVTGLQGGYAQTQLIGTTFAGTISPPIVGPAGVVGPPGVNGTNGTAGALGAQGSSVVGPPGEDADDYGWPIPGIPGAPGVTGPPGPIASLSNPSATIGLTTINGTSTTSAMRFDGAPALSQAIAPTWSARHQFSYAGGGGAVKTTGSVTSSSPTTGDVVVSGGVGVGGSVYAGGSGGALYSGSFVGGLAGLYCGSANNAALDDLVVENTGTSGYTSFVLKNQGATKFLFQWDGSEVILDVVPNAPMQFYTNSTQRMVIGASGQVRTLLGQASTNTSTGDFTTTGGIGCGGALYLGGILGTKASTTGSAGFNLASGTAPTSPSDGDLWYDGTHVQARVAGSTVALDSTGGGGGASTLLPSSIYLGAASGNLFPNYYIPATNTNSAGAIEGIGVVASLASDASAILQFNMPETIPAGTLKLRLLAMANATSGVAKVTVKDKNVAAGASLGTSTLNSETQLSQTWATADILVENKITLTSTPTANDILTVVLTFNTTSWTLAAQSTWQATIVWE